MAVFFMKMSYGKQRVMGEFAVFNISLQPGGQAALAGQAGCAGAALAGQAGCLGCWGALHTQLGYIPHPAQPEPLQITALIRFSQLLSRNVIDKCKV